MYKMSDIIFKDVSLTKRAPAWKFFHANEEKRLAKCQIGNCSEVINWKNGLSGLSNHLRLIHKKIIKRDKSPCKTPDAKTAKKSGIEQFFHIKKDTTEEAIAKMVATDGFNFNQIANSKTLRKAMKSDGHDLPKCHTRVRQLFMKQFGKTKVEVKNKILKYVKDQGRRHREDRGDRGLPWILGIELPFPKL